MSQATKQVKVVAAATPVAAQAFENVAFFDADGNPIDIAGGTVTVTWADVADKPAVIAAGADAAAARAAIGAGTSNVTLPATASAAEMTAGTATATRMFSPKLIADEIARQIAAIPAA